MNKTQRILALEARVAELEGTRLIAYPAFWEPTNNKKAWYVHNTGGAIMAHTSWNQYETNTGKAHPTEELALQSKNLLLATQRLKKAIWNLNKGKPCTFKFDKQNWTVHLCSNNPKPYVWMTVKTTPNWFYLKDEDACKALITSHKEDLLLYFNQ